MSENLDFLFDLLFLFYSLNDSSSTLAISRTLTLWTTVALSAISQEPADSYVRSALVGSSPVSQRLLEYVWTNWDHPVDVSTHLILLCVV